MFKISILAALIGVCCQTLPAPAAAETGTCPGVDGTDHPALASCIVEELCVEGIYDPPRSVDLPTAAVEAYTREEIDVSVKHFRLDVRFRKRAGATIGQCGYTGPTKFMFSLVEPTSATNIAVTFDPSWTY